MFWFEVSTIATVGGSALTVKSGDGEHASIVAVKATKVTSHLIRFTMKSSATGMDLVSVSETVILSLISNHGTPCIPFRVTTSFGSRPSSTFQAERFLQPVACGMRSLL
ncbi:hypothetical protein D3C87_1390810 [compost metagenome]